ncbi:MAG: single-stranded DNA-binding protein [Cytophagaceae bacterium]|nr:single-stranded DNA-binding protein [Cytophagaceae bacterium]
MMSVNKVILVGNVGKDPEVRYFDTDTAVANFSIATTERGYKTRDGKDVPDKTEWHNIVAWRGLAKLAETYIKKGTQIYVEGKIRTRSWDDQNGQKRYTTEIFADVIQLLGKKSDGETSQGNYQSSANYPSQQQASVPVQALQSEDTFIPGTGDVEDDLPF